MSKEQVLKDLESIIRTVKKDIQKRKRASAEEIMRTAALANSYSRLLTTAENIDQDSLEDGDVNYHDSLYDRYKQSINEL